MCPIEVNMTYEPFSKEPEYIEANRAFIQKLDIPSFRKILDLACGIGTMSDLILEVSPGADITCVDIDKQALSLAEDHFRERGLLAGDGSAGNDASRIKAPRLTFIHASADSLPLPDISFDAIIMGNSIHMLPDEGKLLGEVCRVLQRNGIFAFNSSFYAGTMPEGTEVFHHEWVKQALAYILRKDEELKKQGLSGIARKRGSVRRAFSKPWPSAMEWKNMLHANGFTVESVNERTVLMNKRCFETIGAYAGLASVLLSGYPVNLASEALQETAGPTLSLIGMDVVPRYWLEIIACKRGTG